MCYDSLGSYKNGYAIVAQLDRAFGSDPEGQRFESSRSHQGLLHRFCVAVLFIYFIESILQKRRSAL